MCRNYNNENNVIILYFQLLRAADFGLTCSCRDFINRAIFCKRDAFLLIIVFLQDICMFQIFCSLHKIIPVIYYKNALQDISSWFSSFVEYY